MMLPSVQMSRVCSYVSGQTVTSMLPVRSSISAAMKVRPSFVLSERVPATRPPMIVSRPASSAFNSTIEQVSTEASLSAACANGCSER